MATIKDVAQRAGVSPSTISKYLNGGHVLNENADAIQKAIAALDYRANPFARNLKGQRNRSIGILLPDMTAPFFGSVVTAMDKVFREHGYHTLISCFGSDHGLERDNLQFLVSNGIDGLVYAPEDLSSDEFTELMANCRIPVVQIDRLIPGIPHDAVLVNNTAAVYQSITRLVEAGHRRIAMVAGPKSVFTAKERLVGYLRALSDHGIMYSDELVISDEISFATGYRSFETLMSLEDRPTAVFATNYDMTIGFLTAAREQGLRIPEDVDIFGFDSVETCMMMKPPLSVVHQPEQELGQLAASYLIERLEGYTGKARVTRLNCTIFPKL